MPPPKSMVTITRFNIRLRPLKCFLDRGYANVSENTIHIVVPNAVNITEFFKPLKILAVLIAYLYAFKDHTSGMIKNAFSVSSLSVAKEPATTYKKGNTVDNATRASPTYIMTSTILSPGLFLILLPCFYNTPAKCPSLINSSFAAHLGNLVRAKYQDHAND